MVEINLKCNSVCDSCKKEDEIVVDNIYTKDEVNTILKAIEHKNSEKFSTPTQVDDKIKTALTSAVRFRGSVANLEALNNLDPLERVVGYMYNVLENDYNYVWIGDKWDKYSSTIDLSSYATTEYVNEKLKNLPSGSGGLKMAEIVGINQSRTEMSVIKGETLDMDFPFHSSLYQVNNIYLFDVKVVIDESTPFDNNKVGVQNLVVNAVFKDGSKQSFNLKVTVMEERTYKFSGTIFKIKEKDNDSDESKKVDINIDGVLPKEPIEITINLDSATKTYIFTDVINSNYNLIKINPEPLFSSFISLDSIVDLPTLTVQESQILEFKIFNRQKDPNKVIGKFSVKLNCVFPKSEPVL